MKAAGYIRVSSASQVDGYSLDAQENFFKDYCKSRGWEPVRIYREEGKSAHSDAISKRPCFKQLLEDAARGCFDVIVVHTLDRWARNQRITLESIATLGKYNVSLVSITENIDYSNPQGKLFTQMLGSFAEYFSGSLSTHVKKGIKQRAQAGKHLGCIPFGYESCWEKGSKGEKKLKCKPEHPAGIHIHPAEGPMVTELFRRYASGSTTLGELAQLLNDQGYRTKNIHHYPGPDGILKGGPKLFTTASVRGILHNIFYTGKVKHLWELLPGSHEPLVSPEVFDIVQATLRKNCGRSSTMNPHPVREYLLKGLVRCAYCGMPMWAQTYSNGRKYYREHKNSRSHGICPESSGSIPCHIADDQVSQLVENIQLGDNWLEEALAIIAIKDEASNIMDKKQKTIEKLRRMAKAYIDGFMEDADYDRQKRLLQMEIESLIIPEVQAVEEAGNLLQNLPRLWALATETEKRKILISMLDAVYIDTRNNVVVAIKPKPPFKPVFQVAVSSLGSDIHVINEPLNGSSLFLVETGESRTPRPEKIAQNLLQVYPVIIISPG